MRGVLLLGNRQVLIQDFPDPQPGPRQVVVKMRVAAICGSDLHLYRASPEALKWREGLIVGHEPSGDVVALGEDVRYVKIGDRVAVYHYLGCGHCRYCLGGYIQWCPERKGYGSHIHGSDADLLLTNEVNCLVLPPELSYVDGAFIACQASTAFSALRKLNPSGSDTLAIFGLGPVGLCGVLIAKALGARVIGVDIVEERLELARRLGANEVIHGTQEDVVSRLRALTDGEGPNMALETSGTGTAHQHLIDALCKGGKAVLVGAGAQEKTVNLTEIIGKQLTLIGSFVSPINMYWELAAFLIHHRIPLEAMVTHRFPIEDASEAFHLADTARTGKVIFEWK
jgi:threonine dehydrogenase-like Zn-dependent dehydrogenase